MARTVLILLGLFSLSLANHIDLNSYTFSASLSSEIGQGDDYQLYWNINRTGDPLTSIISFAVRVRTTGWVGLGVSPTGDMTGSDVVIGWVNEGDHFLHDRFADARARPPVDESQDWFITDGAEMDGYTVLLFWRYWVTCDDRDNPIEANTARVVFSWNNADPADDNPDNIVQHGSQMRGAISLNLLGGQTVTPTLPEDAKTFTLRVDNITIPNVDTTYFCQPFELDEDLIATERYIVKFAPVISETSLQYVHHVLLYICNGLTSNDPLVGDACGVIDDNVAQCRDGVLLGAWAVGGTDFLYPKDIAYPFGGPGHSRYVLMEMHYNNPNLDEGVIDSSGFEFTYTDVEPTHKAGILTTGLRVTPLQIIPPGVESFKTTGTCFSPCTERFLPEEGITIFANTLHTHLLGTGLVVHHLRKRSLDECEVDEELPPIETNLQYDFNFQQLNYLPEEIHVKPGDELVLECRYKSTERGSVTYGGLSTYDEMCLTFLVYYPRAPLDICLSFPDLTEWAEGLSQLTEEQRQAISGASSNNLNPSTYYPAVEAIDWTIDNEVESLEYQATYGRQFAYCEDGIAEDRIRFTNQIQVDCPYVAPDICSDSPTDSPECVCPETEPTTEPTAGAGTITISTLLMMLCLMAFL